MSNELSPQSNNQMNEQSFSNMNLCFYGAGSMAEAIVRGLLDQQLVSKKKISMLNRSNKERQQELHMRYGIQTAMQGNTNEQYLREADIIFLAMKPKDAVQALRALKPFIQANQLLISVIAGLSISGIQQMLGQDIAVVRAMPNTSSTIGLGATGISYSQQVTEQQQYITETIFQSIGIHVVIEEAMQNAVTSVSGSGPAYFYYVMETMIKGAQAAGFTLDQAKDLVVQTALGAAQMVQATNENPAELRKKVTSPNGTTEAALKVMADQQLDKAILAGIARCAERAAEIGEAIEEDIKHE